MKKLFSGILTALGMLILILDAQTALEGAAEGMDLCIRSVIPSLLPFFVLSHLLVSAFTGAYLPFLRPIGRLCGVPKGAESVLIVGFLGGYPVGAQTVSQMHRDGKISKQTAERLLSFCSNAGPAFIFGIVAGSFDQKWVSWALWGIHMLSALTVGMLHRHDPADVVDKQNAGGCDLPAALRRSISVLANVCGWIILFRIIIAFARRWMLYALPEPIQVILYGILELTNGCCSLRCITDDSLRFIAASEILSFGGLCVMMQTVSVVRPLDVSWYLRGKILQCVISIALSWMTVRGCILFPMILAIIAIILRQLKKRCGNLQSLGV